MSVKPGDIVKLRPSIVNVARDNMESMAGHIVPGWMEVNPAELAITIIAQPTRAEIPFDVNTNLIVEFYR
jgi:small subunit ribosomal protein S4